MSSLLIIALIVLVIQILLFFSIRSGKQEQELKKTSELEDQYHIKTRADAWRLLNSSEIPEADRIKIEDLYKNMK